MWKQVVPQRAFVPFAFAGALFIVTRLTAPWLATPVVSGLLGATALLLLLRPIDRGIRTSSRFRTRVLLVGSQLLGKKLTEEIEACPRRGYTIVGLVEETSSRQLQFSPYLVLGTIDELRAIVPSVKPDRIILALSDRRGRMPADALLEFVSHGIVVEDVADAYERFSGKLAIEDITPGQLIASQKLRKPRALRASQRALSFAAALVLLFVLSPLLGLLAVAIALDSGRPVLFRQMRLGKGGRPFKLIKFRTMQPIIQTTSEWAQDNMKRITRVGRWLRALRLDELPQLVNVIRGDMNLVGPRPHPVSNVKLFREAIPYYVLRCSILPGITGWAQTRYCYANNLEQETEKMRFDLYYIKHMSMWMDLNIMLDTCGLFFASWLTPRTEKRVRIQQPVVGVGSPLLQVVRRPDDVPVHVALLPLVQYASDSVSPAEAEAHPPSVIVSEAPLLPIVDTTGNDSPIAVAEIAPSPDALTNRP